LVDVTVFGTAAADVVLRVADIPKPGDHVPAAPLGWRLGGGSANFACALAEDGHRVELVGPFGRDAMGDMLLTELARCGVETTHAPRVDAPSPRALILIDGAGERTILGSDRGFSSDVYPWIEVPRIRLGACVYVEDYRRFPKAIADLAPNALLVTTPPRSDETSWPADILVGSERDHPADWRGAEFVRAAAIAGPRLRWVVVTRGREGADAYGADDAVHVDTKPVRQVDATGAGDRFAAGLVSGVLGGLAIEAALERGASWAAAGVERPLPIASEAIEELGGRWPGG
jgi:site-specific DNA-methyltransferase (adenine-specific)